MASKSFHGLFTPVEVVSTNNLLRIEQDKCKLQMTRIYYSNLFKIFYFVVIIISIVCIGVSLFQLYNTSLFLHTIEALVTVLLIFETIYRCIMQGWKNYLEQKWNLVDIGVIIASISLLWVGVKIGGGVGEIDSVTAIIMIVTRTLVQCLRLISSIKKKKEQDVQIIDLNDISESDDVMKKDKKFKQQSSTHHEKLEEHKNEFQESQADVQ
ncbi:hypothetical protein SteCoe_26355 [Stentor coeruleus]|uniref:Ion transport domain-containing protein n=1 Tax=Stentor coeruleus TaxID=5963 RepID=A0A1R2BD36_9CILI|nr:hypothetical protein SteCoe_26355 [Stentor coeruleus]